MISFKVVCLGLTLNNKTAPFINQHHRSVQTSAVERWSTMHILWRAAAVRSLPCLCPTEFADDGCCQERVGITKPAVLCAGHSSPVSFE